MFTTVEGLINKIHKALKEQHSYQLGDSKTEHHSDNSNLKSIKTKFNDFLDQLSAYGRGIYLCSYICMLLFICLFLYVL